jgi:hypothetical protein
MPPPPPPEPTVTALHATPATLRLVAGGPAVTLEVAIERRGEDPVTVAVAAPLGVAASPEAVTLDGGQTVARFTLRAAPAAVARADTARVTVRGAAATRAVPVEIARLDFRPLLVAADELTLEPGQRRTVAVRIDRAGGYRGPVTLTLAETAAVAAAEVTVPAGGDRAELVVAVKGGAPPGVAVVGARAAAPGLSHAVPVRVRVVVPPKEVRSFAAHAGAVNCVALAGDGRLALSGGADGHVWLWDVAAGKPRWRGDGHAGPVLSVAFSPDGKYALSGGADGVVWYWTVATGKGQAFEKTHDQAVWLVRFEGNVPVSTGADKAYSWNPLTGKPKLKGGGPFLDRNSRDVVARPGQALAAGTKVPAEAGSAALAGWGTATLAVYASARAFSPRATFGGHGGPIQVMAVSADGRRALTYAADGLVRLFDVWAGRLADGFPWRPATAVTCAALGADGTRALLGGPDGKLQLWQVVP